MEGSQGELNTRVVRFRGSNEERKHLTKLLSNWPSEKELMISEMNYELQRIQTISEFMMETDLRDRTLRVIFNEYKEQFPRFTNGLARFRNEIRLLGYQYKVSTRQFKKNANHPFIAFKAFESILQAVSQVPESVLFFNASTFSFEVNPRRAWQCKEKSACFNSSTNYKRFHILLAAGNVGIFAHQIVLGKIYSETIVDFLFKCWQQMRSQNPTTSLYIVLDNATVHKATLMKKMCVATGTTFLFTASHCPFMNPVEECFRFLKSKYRNKHRIHEFVNKRHSCHRGSKQNESHQRSPHGQIPNQYTEFY